jgi:DNA-directed RNA polymerase specialized sigma24 family protein
MKPKAEQIERIQVAATIVIANTACGDDADDSQNDLPAAASEFETIYDTYAPLLRRIAVAKFGIPTNDAADLVHDVFATYLVSPARVTELRPYLIGAICNASRSYLRRTNVQNAVCSGLDDCQAASDEVLLDAVIRDVLVGRILGRLGRSCRDALHRFYLLGETAAVIAGRRNTSAGYIGRLLHFCRKRARDAYHAMEKRES